MKIGILTLPLHNNYGGILQAYALQTIIERMGHEVVVIDEPIKLKHATVKTLVKRIIKKCVGKPTTFFWERYIYDTYSVVNKDIQRFINTYLHRIVVENPSLLNEMDFDAIVVGSDQIWRPKYYPQIENAYLDFASNWKNLMRIAYAPSFGTDEWEYSDKQTEKITKLIYKFSAISVREGTGIKLCEEHFGIKPQLVLDPTMLLSCYDYNKLIDSTKTLPPDGSLLNYVLDISESIQKLISFISKDLRMRPFSVNGPTFIEGCKAEDCIKPSIETWLRGFRDAEFIITDSFHACVFSLIYNKPFCVIGNKKRGMTRFRNLLELFNQEFRLIVGVDEFKIKKENLKEKPNVKFEKSEFKQRSFDFLNILKSDKDSEL